MATLSKPALLSGGPAFFPHSTELRAGPLSLLLEQGEIRRVRLGDREVIRRIYLTLRGPDWSTIVPAVADLNVDAGGGEFKAAYSLVHRQGEYDFAWKVTITGNAQGTLRFEARGRAGASFDSNRVGICLLHPLEECVGKSAILSVAGAARAAEFPRLISPHEPFTGFQEFSHQWEDGLEIRLKYEGGIFETEDQRNWTDGSFKTYCPPQAAPKPRRIEAGWETVQAVTLVLPMAAAAPAPEAAAASLSAEAIGPLPLPAWGFGCPSHGLEAGPRDRERLRALAPSHLRVNLRLSASGYATALAAAAREAEALGIPLEAAVVVGEDVEASLSALAGAWTRSGAQAIRWLMFSDKSDKLPEADLNAARKVLQPLSPEAEFAAGSKSDFVLLNRGYAEGGFPGGTALAYAMTPQVHLFDNRNLVESLQGQEWTLRTAKAKWPGPPVAVSPVTLKRSPFAAGLKKPAPPELSAWRSQADTRQLSLFGAGWTLGCFSVLARHGAASATFYETTGTLGLMPGETCGLPERSFAGSDLVADPEWVYPLYHVFADLAEFQGGEFLPMVSSRPLQFRGFGLRLGSRQCLLVANLEGVTGKLRIDFPAAPARLRRLNASNAMQAMSDPEGWRRQSFEPWSGPMESELLPFEVIRMDF
jgi:hypothetical protein